MTEEPAGATPPADAPSPSTDSGPQRHRRRVAGLLLVLLVVAAAAWSLGPTRLSMGSERASGHRNYAAPANGDHMYYASMALQYAGVPYLESLDEVAAYFQYPKDWRKAYFLNPDRSPLIYPRSVLPLLAAPLEPAMGVASIFVPGIVCGLAAVALLIVAARRWGAVWTLAPPLALYLVSPAFAEYGSGIYTEAILMLVVVAGVLCLPLAGRRPGISGVLWLATLAVIAELTRQAGLIVPAMVLAGFLGAVLLARGARRETARLWVWPAVSSTAAGLVSTLVVTVWAPYDVLAFTQTRTGSGSLARVVLTAFGQLPRELAHAIKELPPAWWSLVALIVLGGLATLWLLREPLGWVILGAASFPVTTAALNGTDVLRYIAPVYPLFVLAIAVVAHRVLLPRWPAYTALAGSDGATPVEAARRTDLALSGAAVATLVVLLAATVWVYRPASLSSGGTLAAADLEGPWPLSAASAELLCGGDDGQAWLVVDGERYAFSGTALARRALTAPSAKAVRAPSVAPWSTQANELLNRALATCTPPLTTRP